MTVTTRIEDIRLPDMSRSTNAELKTLVQALYDQWRDTNNRLWALEISLGIAPRKPLSAVVGSSKARRHAFTASYDYCGTAPYGSANSASVWTITRLLIASNGTVTTTTATNVKWDDRLTATYV